MIKDQVFQIPETFEILNFPYICIMHSIYQCSSRAELARGPMGWAGPGSGLGLKVETPMGSGRAWAEEVEIRMNILITKYGNYDFLSMHMLDTL